MYPSLVARAGDGLLHPVPLAALVLLLANDHIGKWAYPGVITGKLSDVAGLVLFPLLLQAGCELAQAATGRWAGPSRRVLIAAVLATAGGFALVKTVPLAGDVYCHGLAALQWPARATAAVIRGEATSAIHPVALTQDVSDLLTLPAVAAALWAGRRRV